MNIFKDVAAKRYKLAVWSMALGIIGFCMTATLPGALPLVITNIIPFICGLLAWIFSAKAKKDYYTVETATTSTIGMLTGIISAVISGAMIIIPIAIILIVIVVAIVVAILALVSPTVLPALASLLLSILRSFV